MVHIVCREEWKAREPRQRNRQTSPVEQVYCIYTHTDSCDSIRSCRALVKDMQRTHMQTLQYRDIGYNFLVGGDGNVYEGRGWQECPELKDDLKDLAEKSISIGLCGHGKADASTVHAMSHARESLIRYGVKYKFILETYKKVTLK